MEPYQTPVQLRERGHTPCSIGTSLALESLGGFGEYPSKEPSIQHYNALWINLRTLFRNLYQAIPTVERSNVSVDELCDGLVEDIEVVRSTIDHIAINPINVVFYYVHFTHLEKEFPLGLLKTTYTKIQSIERALEKDTLAIVKTLPVFHTRDDLLEFSVYLTRRDGKTAILTHYPIDLLSRHRFQSLTLLESHTGALKTPAQWYTKLTGGQRCHRLPFNRLSLQLFGDQNLLFSGYKPKLKKMLLELAEQEHWTPVTTKEKIHHSLKSMKDRAVAQFFEQLLR